MAATRTSRELPVLSLRHLGRALLARQFLLERTRLGAAAAIERLACLQAQFAPSPYVALWSRIAEFEREQLTRPIVRGEVVKATLMRATLHLVKAREYPAYALATLEGRRDAWRPPDAGAIPERHLEALHRRVLAFARTPRTRGEIEAHIADALPADERMRRWLSWAAVATGQLLWEPAGAFWEHRRDARYVAAPSRLRRPPPSDAAFDLLVRRYLAAFGPASVADIATWSSARVPPLRAALERIRGLRRFRDEKGRELFDLPRASIPDPGTRAPARFLARFDAAILGHVASERDRILPAAYRKAVIHAAEVEPTFLVDGTVAGIWRFVGRGTEAVIELRPFGRLTRGDRAALGEEGERLARFMAPDARTHGVRA